MGFIFLDRKRRAVAKASMETAAKRVVRRNLSPVIAPEGTRSPPDSLLPFKKGAFHLALQSSSPIVPMLIYKAGSHWPRTGYYCRRSGTLRVRFLAPIELEAENPDELQSDVDKIRGRFLEELGQ
jgi:1-acyl-sn-glycerol-3-phosphate acyltransferase